MPPIRSGAPHSSTLMCAVVGADDRTPTAAASTAATTTLAPVPLKTGKAAAVGPKCAAERPPAGARCTRRRRRRSGGRRWPRRGPRAPRGARRRSCRWRSRGPPGRAGRAHGASTQRRPLTCRAASASQSPTIASARSLHVGEARRTSRPAWPRASVVDERLHDQDRSAAVCGTGRLRPDWSLRNESARASVQASAAALAAA